jgi:hypothetical protein
MIRYYITYLRKGKPMDGSKCGLSIANIAIDERSFSCERDVVFALVTNTLYLSSIIASPIIATKYVSSQSSLINHSGVHLI